MRFYRAILPLALRKYGQEVLILGMVSHRKFATAKNGVEKYDTEFLYLISYVFMYICSVDVKMNIRKFKVHRLCPSFIGSCTHCITYT